MIRSDAEVLSGDLAVARKAVMTAIGELPNLTRKRYVGTPALFAGAASYVVAEPLGIVLILVPFNHPISLAIAPLVEALAAGNVVVIKPSEKCVESSKMLADRLAQYCAESVVVREGDGEVGARLLTRRWDLVHFMGSREVGSKVAKAAALTGSRVVLHVGGINPVVIAEDCNIKVAAKRLIAAKTMFCGQSCTTPNHCYVPRAIIEEFGAALKEAVQQMYGDKPLDSPHYSRIVTETAAAQMWNKLEDAHGGTIIVGGQVDVASRGVAPTVVVNPALTSRLMTTEVFGPILSLVMVETVEDGIALAEAECARQAPLAAYIFTANPELVEEFSRRVRSGSLMVNDVALHLFNLALPMGSLSGGSSGTLFGSAPYASAFWHPRAVMSRHVASTGGLLENAMRFPPFSKNVIWLMSKVLSLTVQVTSSY